MKKSLWLFLVALIATILVTSILNIPNRNSENITDALKFKKEYEDLNDILDSEGNKKYLNLSIDDSNKVKYIEFNEVMNILDERTGVIYFGRPNCPWSRSIIPILLDVAKENEIENIYYFNADSIRDIKRLDEKGNIVTDKEGTDGYYKLLDKLDSVVSPYKGLNDESLKRLYFPTVVFVVDGKIMGYHTGTVDTHTDPNKELTGIEQEELTKIYKDNIEKILNNVCNLDNINCEEEGDK